MQHRLSFAALVGLCTVLLTSCQDAPTRPLGSPRFETTANYCAGVEPTFFVEPTTWGSPVDPTLDSEWESAVNNDFVELDLDEFPNGFDVDVLVAGDITIDIGQAGSSCFIPPDEPVACPGNGIAATARILRASYHCCGGSYGTVYESALLNVVDDPPYYGLRHSEITFTFSEPVFGFGLWIFDDAASSPQNFRLHVTDPRGVVTTSDLLESGNGNAHFMEGFLGATAPRGIVKASVEVLENGIPYAKAFEVDHPSVSPLRCQLDPIELILALRQRVEELNLQRGIESSLDAKLAAVLRALEDAQGGNDGAAANVLAAFVDAVEAQSGIHITEQDAESLVGAAQEIIDLLN